MDSVAVSFVSFISWFIVLITGKLPPGIAKNLQRGKPLPPGIAKQVLPSGLIAQLPPPPKGFERIEVAGKVLLVEIATQVIHDVLEDIILGK